MVQIIFYSLPCIAGCCWKNSKKMDWYSTFAIQIVAVVELEKGDQVWVQLYEGELTNLT